MPDGTTSNSRNVSSTFVAPEFRSSFLPMRNLRQRATAVLGMEPSRLAVTAGATLEIARNLNQPQANAEVVHGVWCA